MEDTIAAISTAYGESGIGIVRMSGENSRQVLEKIFVPLSRGKITERKMTYGKIVDPADGKTIDEVLAVFMKGPKTYTREDIAEINCHGSIVSLRKILALALDNGARLAEPGEFTKRAFLNGRLDLSQAEAVIDVIKAKTDKSFDIALDQLEGSLSARIKTIRRELLDVLVNITVNIDYPDEDIEVILYDDLKEKLTAINEKTAELLASADSGKIIREGLNIAIIGKPNVGKSSLLNSLLRESRAIVTEVPGTTRDTIEEIINIKGIPVRLTDTAGIRSTSDQIEIKGIEKSKAAFNTADLVILVLDGSRPLSQEDREIAEFARGKKLLTVINKSDLPRALREEELCEMLPEALIIETAAKKGQGIEHIEEEILKLVYGGDIKQSSDVLISNIRHEKLLKDAHESLSDALKLIEKREALDFLEVDINDSYQALGEIIGEVVSGDIIDEVFSRFCLGK